MDKRPCPQAGMTCSRLAGYIFSLSDLIQNLLAFKAKYKKLLRKDAPNRARISSRPTATRLTMCFILDEEPAKVPPRTETIAPFAKKTYLGCLRRLVNTPLTLSLRRNPRISETP